MRSDNALDLTIDIARAAAPGCWRQVGAKGWPSEREEVRFKVNGALGETRVRVPVEPRWIRYERVTKGMVVALVTLALSALAIFTVIAWRIAQ